MNKYIAAKNDESIYWEIISAYDIFKYLLDGELYYQMNKAEAFGFIKNLIHYLDLDENVHLEGMTNAYKGDKDA